MILNSTHALAVIKCQQLIIHLKRMLSMFKYGINKCLNKYKQVEVHIPHFLGMDGVGLIVLFLKITLEQIRPGNVFTGLLLLRVCDYFQQLRATGAILSEREVEETAEKLQSKPQLMERMEQSGSGM